MFLVVLPWSTAFRGGVSVVVQQLTRQWQATGVACKVVVDDWHAREPTLLGNETHFAFAFVDQPSRALGMLRSLLRAPAALWRTQRFLRSESCTGVNFHYPSLSCLGPVLLKASGLYRGGLVLSFHGTDVRTPGSAIERGLWRFIFRHADAVTACSAGLRERLLQQMPASADKVKVAYNGVDLAVFSPPPDSAVAPGRLIVSLGTYIPLKGQEVLIQAFAALAAQRPELRLTIAGGDGPQRQALQDFAAQHQLSDRVNLLCNISQAEVAKLLREASMLVQASRREAFGLAVIEAAACGVPVLASAIGGHLEIIEAGRTGWLFAMDDVEGCREAIAQALSDPAEARRRAEALRQEVGVRFTWARLALQMRNLLSP